MNTYETHQFIEGGFDFKDTKKYLFMYGVNIAGLSDYFYEDFYTDEDIENLAKYIEDHPDCETMQWYKQASEENSDLTLIDYLIDGIESNDECFDITDLYLFTKGYYVPEFGGSFNNDHLYDILLHDVFNFPEELTDMQYSQPYGPECIMYFKTSKPRTQKEFYEWVEETFSDIDYDCDYWGILKEIN